MRLAFLLVATGTVFGQGLVGPQSKAGQAVTRLLDAAPAGQSLGCKVEDLRPVLNLALRYQTGYRVTFPFAKLPEKDGTLFAAFRVTSQSSGKEYLFRQAFRFPQIPPKTKLQGVLDGGFFIGEGTYRVKWLLSDLNGQECRKEWQVKLNIKDKDPRLSSRMEAGEVSSLRLNIWLQRKERPRPFRVAILLHGSPIFPRASVLSGYDISLFVTSIASLLEDTPFTETSVTAFNLQKRNEVFHAARMGHKEFMQLYDSLDDLEVATIDLKHMLDRKGYLNLLASMVNREIAAKDPPDAVIFIGPNTRQMEKFPENLLEGASQTRFFYLKYGYHGRFYPFQDSIDRLVRSRDGKVFELVTPKDFAEAIRRIEDTLSKAQSVELESR